VLGVERDDGVARQFEAYGDAGAAVAVAQGLGVRRVGVRPLHVEGERLPGRALEVLGGGRRRSERCGQGQQSERPDHVRPSRGEVPRHRHVRPVRGPAAQWAGLPNVVRWWPNPWAKAMSSRLCGCLLYFTDRPVLKSSPPPTSTNGMLSIVCEL